MAINGWHDGGQDTLTQTQSVTVTLAPPQTRVVNKPEPKVDAFRLAKGRAVFTDDVEMPGMLYAGLLTSPLAHALCEEMPYDEKGRLQVAIWQLAF